MHIFQCTCGQMTECQLDVPMTPLFQAARILLPSLTHRVAHYPCLQVLFQKTQRWALLGGSIPSFGQPSTKLVKCDQDEDVVHEPHDSSDVNVKYPCPFGKIAKSQKLKTDLLSSYSNHPNIFMT